MEFIMSKGLAIAWVKKTLSKWPSALPAPSRTSHSSASPMAASEDVDAQAEARPGKVRV